MIWSYSFLKDFENCQLKAFHRYVARDLPRLPNTGAQNEGNAVHKALERRLNGAELPPEHAHLERFAEAFDRDGLEVKTEAEMGLDAKLQPCGFWDKGVWGRTKIDVLAIDGDRAVCVDWKTGRRWDDDLQLQIDALFVFAHYPDVDQVMGTAVWLKDDQISPPITFRRATLGPLWGMILGRVRAVEQCEAQSLWLAKPNKLCGWCNVKTCQHNKAGVA